MYKKIKKLLPIFLFLVLLILGLNSTIGQQETDQERLVVFLDGFERRTGDNVLVYNEYFSIFHNYDSITLRLVDLHNNSLVYEEQTTGRNFVQLRTRYDSELIVEDEEGNTVLRKIIREPTIMNRALYTYELERFDIALSITYSFIFSLVFSVAWFSWYDVKEW